MNNRKRSNRGLAVTLAALLPLAWGIASAAPLTPEMAAKRERVRKQKEQQVTPAERKAAADWLRLPVAQITTTGLAGSSSPS